MFAGVGPILIDNISIIDKFPEKGGHVIVKKSIKTPGGASANVLYGLSKFGIDCTLYSTIGEGKEAEFLTKFMGDAGVKLKLKTTHQDTGKVDIFVDSKGERTFFVHPNAAGVPDIKIENPELDKFDYMYLDPFPADNSLDIHLDIAKRFKRSSSLRKDNNKKVILNCSHSYSKIDFAELSKLLKYIDILILSEFEFQKIGKKEEDFLKFVETLVVTMSEKGSRAVTKTVLYGESTEGVQIDRQIRKKIKRSTKIRTEVETKVEAELYAPPYTVKAIDTTGAGDSFACGFLFAYLMGASLSTCLKTGNYVASHNIQYYGGKNFPDKSDVVDFIKQC